MGDRIALTDSARNTLFVKRTVRRTGGVTFGWHQYCEWSGPGSVAWQVSVASPGRYRAALCYSAPAHEPAFEIVAGGTKIAGTLPPTDGIYEDPGLNFERVVLQDDLTLGAGETEIVLRFPSLWEGHTLNACSVELTPEAGEEAIRQDAKAARDFCVVPGWFKTAGYGLMFHWTARSQPRRGPQKTYHDAVAEFDVFRFAEMVAATGAKYVILTVNHADPHCPAPIAAWEKLHPGWTTDRDLLREIAQALAGRGIRLILYLNSPLLAGLEARDKPAYIQVQCEVVGEIGQRYGKLIAGYWFDSWYQAFTKYGHGTTEQVQKAARVGNPERTIAFNYWLFPVCSPWQDYWAGEVNGFKTKIPSGPILERGAGKGYFGQVMHYLESTWVHDTPNTEVPPPRFTEDELIGYIRGFMARECAVTLNLEIFQDGTIGHKTFELLQAVEQAIRR